MSRLKKCNSCGNMIARDAKRCPQCGGRVNKSHGCLLFIILVALFFIGTCAVVPNSKSGHDVAQNPNSPENADAFQVEVFSNAGAELFAQNFLEQYSGNVKYSTVAKVDKAETSNPWKTKKSGDFWTVSQEFTEKNAFGVDLKHSYCAILEFCSGKGYRMAMLMIDNVVVYPK